MIRPSGVPSRFCAGGIVTRVDAGGVWVALARETKRPGYVLPKDGIDPGEDDLEAAVREIEEEAGFRQLVCVADLGSRSRLTYTRKAWSTTHYFLFCTEERTPRPIDRLRHPPPTWFRLDDMPDLFWPEQTQLVRLSSDVIERLSRAVAR